MTATITGLCLRAVHAIAIGYYSSNSDESLPAWLQHAHEETENIHRGMVYGFAIRNDQLMVGAFSARSLFFNTVDVECSPVWLHPGGMKI